MFEITRLFEMLHMNTDHEEKFSIIWIDIDFFTRYCVRFSKKDCDRLMERITEFLKAELKQGILAYEPGDDAYVFRLNGIDAQEAYQVMCNVQKKMRKQRFADFLPEEYRFARITFSAGISSFPENGQKDLILRKALVSLYFAKSMRRNYISIYQEQSEEEKRVYFDEKLQAECILGKWGIEGIVTDSVKAKDCLLWEPQAIATDCGGRLYIANQNSHQILCKDEELVSVVAGDGSFDKKNENGIEAVSLNKPTGLFVAGKHIYIADTGNDRVTDMNLADGKMKKIAGCGEAGYFGDGAIGSSAGLNKPGGVVSDRQGNLYIVDTANNVIRKVDIHGKISTFAGDGKFNYKGDGGQALQAGFNEIYGICIEVTGKNLYVCDYLNNRIRRINIESGIITTVAGGGQVEDFQDGIEARNAVLSRPVAACLDKYGNLYIAESGYQDIRIVTEQKIYTLVGCRSGDVSDKATVNSFRMSNPNSLAVYEDTLFILDGGNNRICKIELWKSQKYCCYR